MVNNSASSWRVELEGIGNLQKALKALAEPDAPFLRQALTESGELLRGAAASRAPGGIASKVGFSGIRGTVGGGLRAVIVIDHPGGRSMEFGRVWYYRKDFESRQAQLMRSFSYAGTKAAERRIEKRLSALAGGQAIGNNRPGSKRRKGGMVAAMHRYKVGEIGSAGQKPRPYLGVVNGGAALAAVREQVEQKLTDAVKKEWARLAAGN